MEEEQRHPTVQCLGESTGKGMSKPEDTKPFRISKREVYEAWKKVRKNRGAAGIDKQTIEVFEQKLGENLYPLWNRMASGSYFPEPVRRVEIPKPDGKKRPLGIPTVRDRIAQEVVRARLEPILEAKFHEDSYGFRPKRSARMAITNCRQRCFRFDWVVDVDIEKFFDTISHELLLKAVEKHSPEKWMVLYIKRWLEAGVMIEGVVTATEKGTPQGGVISPLLANLFLHYACDLWMTREHPANPFERYADDLVIHCRSKEEAEAVKTHLEQRCEEVGLRLHPEKTRLVHCHDSKRKGNHEDVSFAFLGYTFKPRAAISKFSGRRSTVFLPAASAKAKKKLRDKLKERKLFRNTTQAPEELAEQLNPISRGWLNYFTVFYRSAVKGINHKLNSEITGWFCRKYKIASRRAIRMLRQIYRTKPKYFAHWEFFPFCGRTVRAG